MTPPIGLSGSSRAGSFSTAMPRNAAERLPQGMSFGIRTLHGIPLYNAAEDASVRVVDRTTRVLPRMRP